MTLLTRQAILEAEDITTRDVEVPEWGGTVRVKAMTGAQRDRFETSVTDAKGKMQRRDFFARFVAWTVIDESGQRLFSEQDIAALGKKSSAALMRVAKVAQKLSAVADEDVEELLGNSDPGQSDDSISD